MSFTYLNLILGRIQRWKFKNFQVYCVQNMVCIANLSSVAQV